MNGQELFEDLGICTQTVHANTDICSSLKHIIDNNLIEVYPNIYVTLRITLTVPVTAASAERSFSKLKLIQAYLTLSLPGIYMAKKKR
jgi:hypothetical protein